MSFLVANGSHPYASRTRGLKSYTARFLLANGADPTLVHGEGVKLVRAGEGSYTLTLDESMLSADGVLWWDVKLAGQTDLQYCSATVGDVGDANDGLTMTISTGTVSVDNARTADDIAGGILLVKIEGFGPGVTPPAGTPG